MRSGVPVGMLTERDLHWVRGVTTALLLGLGVWVVVRTPHGVYIRIAYAVEYPLLITFVWTLPVPRDKSDG